MRRRIGESEALLRARRMSEQTLEPQLDTRQDASYFGQWINPERREIFCYCEGDTCLTRCETDAEMVEELARISDWNAEQGYQLFGNGKAAAIDPGFNENLKAACVSAGLQEYLH